MHVKIQQHKKPNKRYFAAGFMPQGEEDLRILHERAELFAKHAIDNIENAHEVSYVKFRLGVHEQYGIPYQYAKEVMHNVTLTKLPFVPSLIAGIINRRGMLLAVLDLKQLFHIQPTEYDNNSYIIVVMGNGMTIGILADGIEGSNAYDPITLDVSLSSDGVIKPEYIVGLHKGRTAIINVEGILSDPQIQVRSKL